MDSVLLSRITKDFLNLDPELVSPRKRYQAGWEGSTLSFFDVPRGKKALELLALRRRFASLFKSPVRIPLPQDPQGRSDAPPLYFFKGEKEEKTPIDYLLTETTEILKSRASPANASLLRSLCKGKGVLKKSSSGLVYLDIDARFISTLLPFLKKRGLLAPPYIESIQRAYIPIISKREAGFHFLEEVEGLGKSFSFEIEGLYSMKPDSWEEVEEVWFFKVKSEELEFLRRQNLLSSLPQGHSFHIAVAIKPYLKSKAPPKKPAFMKINPTFLVT